VTDHARGTSDEPRFAGEVCFVNIGPAQRRRRRRLGVISLAAAALLTGVLGALSLPRAWLALVTVLAFAGFVGIFQARAKT
jgi:hypothetical protein